MKKFLLILAASEKDWEGLLTDPLIRGGAEVVVRHNIEEALNLIKNDKFTEIITGSFSQGDPQGPWRKLWNAAQDVGSGVTLFTGQTYQASVLEGFRGDNIKILAKNNFDEDVYFAERFGATNPAELE